MAIELQKILNETALKLPETRMLFRSINQGDVPQTINEFQAVAILLYDALLKMNLPPQLGYTILNEVTKSVQEYIEEMSQPQAKLYIFTLQIIDNRWLCWTNGSWVFDLVEIKNEPQLPSNPFISMAMSVNHLLFDVIRPLSSPALQQPTAGSTVTLPQ
jgi:hypothetical protein